MKLFVPTDKRVLWQGRTFQQGGTVHAGFPGVSGRLHVSAKQVAVQITSSSDECYIRVGRNEDFSTKIRLEKGKQIVELLDGQLSGALALFRCTESWQGTLSVEQFWVDGNLLLPEERFATSRLMFVGDSITSGAATLLSNEAELNDSIANDAYHSYGIELGRRLSAEVHLVSYGGRGVYRDWQGYTSEEITNAPEFFERAMPDDAGRLWDHDQYTPDVIVICLGQNDFNQGIVPEDMFVPKYLSFLRRVKQVHPQSKILLLNSPMHPYDEKRTILNDYLTRIATVSGVNCLEVSHQHGSDIDAHPTSNQHQCLADEIEPVLRRLIVSR